MKLLIDVNLSPLWAPYLRAAGHEAHLWTSLGAADATDADIVAYATEHGFVIFTRDLDFSAILAASHARRPSVVQFRGPGQFPEENGAFILTALDQLAVELDSGALVTLDIERIRIRILPIHPQ